MHAGHPAITPFLASVPHRLLSHGLGWAGMDTAVEVMLSAFAGEFF